MKNQFSRIPPACFRFAGGVGRSEEGWWLLGREANDGPPLGGAAMSNKQHNSERAMKEIKAIGRRKEGGVYDILLLLHLLLR